VPEGVVTEAPAAVATEAPAAVPVEAVAVSFSKDVNPILQKSCFNCHGGERTSRGLSFASYDTLMAGSQNGAVIDPGNPDGSKLLQLILSGKMPKRGDKLTPEQAQLISDWIAAGAQNN
jgi:mono/diheme cytochrome c family protein